VAGNQCACHAWRCAAGDAIDESVRQRRVQIGRRLGITRLNRRFRALVTAVSQRA
jgi:hypothetical protein